MIESFELEMLWTLATRFNAVIAGKPGKLVFKSLTTYTSGGSRNSERVFPLVVDPRCRGLGAQPPDAE